MFYSELETRFFFSKKKRTASYRKVCNTDIKYPLLIHDAWLPAFSADPMIAKLAANVVWSISASRSTLAQARKIYTWSGYLFFEVELLISKADFPRTVIILPLVTYRVCSLNVIALFVAPA